MTLLKLYGASWCQPCKAIKPIISEILSQNPSVQYQYIDVDQRPDDAQQSGVRSVPTVIIFKGGVETNRFIGAQPKAVYEQAIK